MLRLAHIVPLVLMIVAAPMAGAASPEPGAFAHRFTSIDGEPLPLGQWAGKALLVVNTASFCGFTYQYSALEKLWQRYRDRGLVVLGVPSGDFAGQEHRTNGEIKQFCETRFDIDFPITEKTAVTGTKAHPLFVWLHHELGEKGVPRWNFTKFLIAPDGRAIASFPSSVEPDAPQLVKAIEAALPSS